MSAILKKLVVLAGIAACMPLAAQNYKISYSGVIDSGNGLVYRQPMTEITVDLRFESTMFIPGPYARFAQRFLGVAAPLAEKHSNSIVSAEIFYTDTDSNDGAANAIPALQAADVDDVMSDAVDEFPAFSFDKASAGEQNAETLARNAANIIYKLRTSRLELITGYTGENVFGGGLAAALAQIDKLEKQYIELFLGRQITSQRSYRFIVVPDKSKNSYVICRFSESAGLLPEGDLSGQPIVLDMRSEGKVLPLIKNVDNTKKVLNRTVEVRVAENVTCKVMNGREELARAIVPVYQFGEDKLIEVPRKSE